ncbi:MAG: homoserine O-succinyltransferase [Bacteroidales bacterium]|nr:homoserine O-succinyltransferase [Bacteroidales bacterium]MCM1147773.1 homoserine O-succinyltransferase [Bacteroidales bacterium]MCM1206617.1 homoserine O-succinyltransferase [Bacillota bacterium]MCM1510642.1 homoserine O-succinyltransferase [Clostridium sp.]
MPLILPEELPAIDVLKQENIFTMGYKRADSQQIRPLRLAVLNLMPIKITTETDFIRILSNSALQIQVDFMKIKSHTSKNTPIEHMLAFYRNFEDMKKEKYDGLIVTGAPLEFMDYEEVTYWKELQEVFNWAHHNVTSTIYVCWAAFAGLYHFYGVPKHNTMKKIFGVFEHEMHAPELPIFRGFDDVFFAPHSRHCGLRREDIEKVPGLDIIAESREAGVTIVHARNGREFFITCHLEYSPLTLDGEYRRDMEKDMEIDIPKNYYPDDNPDIPPVVRWRAAANLLYTNWLNYYVYQETPFNINDIK